MKLLIDGYNLLHASGVFGKRRGQLGLHDSRAALLASVSQRLESRMRAQTTVVFDAADAPPGLPHRQVVAGLVVLFAANHADADALIEELIECSSAPRELTVVSSDHRLHRAARRRRATVVDSEVWWSQLGQPTLGSPSEGAATEAADAAGLSPKQAGLSGDAVDYWLAEFEGPTDDQDEES